MCDSKIPCGVCMSSECECVECEFCGNFVEELYEDYCEDCENYIKQREGKK